jgi:hypothetical protein
MVCSWFDEALRLVHVNIFLDNAVKEHRIDEVANLGVQ